MDKQNNDIFDAIIENIYRNMLNDRPLMTKNIDGNKCPKCGAVEVDAMTPRTVYACGSSDYDQRPNTFSQSEQCRSTCH